MIGVLAASILAATPAMPEIAAPTDLRAANLASDGFMAEWTLPDGAATCWFWLYREERIEATGDVVWTEDFSSVTNATGNPVELRDAAWQALSGWSGTKVYVPKRSGGTLQLGTGDLAGELVTPPLPKGEGLSVMFRAARYAYAKEGREMPVTLLRGTECLSAWSVTLADESAEYVIDLPVIVDDDCRIAFGSSTDRATAASAHGRVLLDRVALVTGATHPRTVRETLYDGKALKGNGFRVGELSPGKYVFCLRAVYPDGQLSEFSAECCVVIEPIAPPPPPADDGYGDPVRYPPLLASELSRSVLRNGRWRLEYAPPIPDLVADRHLQCFTGGVRTVNAVKSNRGTTQYQGFYEWNGGTVGFGTYTAADVDRTFGVCIRNDFIQPVKTVRVEVGYGQWGAKNTLSDVLKFEWAASEKCAVVAPADWQPVPDGNFSAVGSASNPDLPIIEPVRSLAIPFRGRKNLLLRWTDTCPSGGKNAAMGIWRLKITLETSGGGAVIFR